MLAIITNDGWWANTSGHKQHLNYARLRAIETRRWVARSANTGVSAVINPKGDLLETRLWNTADAIKYNIPAVAGTTFFVKNGPLVFNLALLLFGALMMYNIVMVFRKRFLPNNKG